jgi:hypothetical protein
VTDTDRMSSSPGGRDLIGEEDRSWAALHALIDPLPPELVTRPGYFEEGWSVKDLVGHLGSWLAAAGAVLERIRFGTYRPEEIDVDAMNARFYQAMADVPYGTVLAQTHASRSRMLTAWGELPEITGEADRWVRKAGPDHYAEHLPRLRAWVQELDPHAAS